MFKLNHQWDTGANSHHLGAPWNLPLIFIFCWLSNTVDIKNLKNWQVPISFRTSLEEREVLTKLRQHEPEVFWGWKNLGDEGDEIQPKRIFLAPLSWMDLFWFTVAHLYNKWMIGWNLCVLGKDTGFRVDSHLVNTWGSRVFVRRYTVYFIHTNLIYLFCCPWNLTSKHVM